MVASNRERQAAFRARKKIQPLAEKHFGGEHYVNLGDFLTVMKFDEATFRSLLPEGKSDGLPPDLVLDLMAEVHEFELANSSSPPPFLPLLYMRHPGNMPDRLSYRPSGIYQ